MKAQLCPKCNGQGVVSKPPWIAGDQNQWVSSSTSRQCDVCLGLKIIYIPDDTRHEERIQTLEKQIQEINGFLVI